MKIGRHIRARRTGLGLTQQELAAELGVSHQYLSRIELGDKTPSLQLLVRISHVLGVSADHLLTGREVVPPDAAAAIRADPSISAVAKRHLVGLLVELRDARTGIEQAVSSQR